MAEGLAEGLAEGALRKQWTIALNLLRDSLSIEVVARGTELSIAEVQQLQQTISDSAQS